jgi:hypothetical protein
MRSYCLPNLFGIIVCADVACGPESTSAALAETTLNETGMTDQATGLSTSTGGDKTAETDTMTTGIFPTTTEQVNDVGAPAECDIWSDSCDTSHKCMPVDITGDSTFDAHRCVPVSGETDPIGGVCSAPKFLLDGLDTCEKGAICWELDQDGNGTCFRFCDGSLRDPICPPASRCITISDVFDYCSPYCNPLLDDCDAERLCLPIVDSEIWTCYNHDPANAGAFGEPCTAENTCAEGLLCLGMENAKECSVAPGCCTPVCDLSAPVECPGVGQECLPWYETPPPGFEDVGFCAVP